MAIKSRPQPARSRHAFDFSAASVRQSVNQLVIFATLANRAVNFLELHKQFGRCSATTHDM